MMKRISLKSAGNSLLACALSVFLLCTTNIVFAQIKKVTTNTAKLKSTEQKSKIHIVQFTQEPVSNYNGDIEGYPATKSITQSKSFEHNTAVEKYTAFLKQKQSEVLAEYGIGKDKVVYSHTFTFNGLAAAMTAKQAEKLRNDPSVKAVWKDKKYHLQTGNVSPPQLDE